MSRNTLIIIIILAILVAGIWIMRRQPVHNTQTPQPAGTASGIFTADPVSKHSGCLEANGLPDHSCTPGAIDMRVTQDGISSTICATGYTKTVRPPASYTDNLKRQQMKEYNLSGSAKDYEEDHLIPLELGGSPTDTANLWPEPYMPFPGARDKDHVENYLHSQVCKGTLSLAEAQREIAANWAQVYQAIPDITRY